MTHEKLTPEDVEQIHADIYEEYPDTTALTDNPNLGYVSQAIARDVMGQQRTVLERAAALLRFLVETHPFPDGNKRTAYNATAVFLAGYRRELDTEHSIRTLLKLLGTDSTLPDVVIENYLGLHSTQTTPDSPLPKLPTNATHTEKLEYATKFREYNREIFDALATE